MDGEQPRRARLLGALQRLDAREGLIGLARGARRRLPGDYRYGDPLSLSGDEAPAVLGRRISALADERPSALRELGMGALQVWQALSEAQGRGHGDRELAILFTDLVDFSDWALDAGDAAAVEHLRRVGEAVEQPVKAHGGRVVKRLGDGLMAVFEDPIAAVNAACEAAGAVDELDGPGLRAGVHLGRPRKLGGDYFGVDVNIAARLADAAKPGEILVSDRVLEKLGPDAAEAKKRRFRAKGAPRDLTTYALSRR
jgi:adenylate cyclase